MKTCPDCGCRVYEYGCVNCNEQDYIDMQRYELDMPMIGELDGPAGGAHVAVDERSTERATTKSTGTK